MDSETQASALQPHVDAVNSISVNNPVPLPPEEEPQGKNGLVQKPTFKSIWQAKKRLLAFSSQKVLLNSPKKPQEESEKSEKVTKKNKKEPYPDEKLKCTIKEIEEIKLATNPALKQELLDQINLINLDSVPQNVFVMPKLTSTDGDNQFRKIELKSRNYRRTDDRESPSVDRKSRSHKKDTYPQNWTEFKEKDLSDKMLAQLKPKPSSDFSKFFTLETPPPLIDTWRSRSEKGTTNIPFKYIRRTKAKPHVYYSVNFDTVKESCMSRKQLYNIVSSSRRQLIEKLFSEKSKIQPSASKVEARKWYPKSWRKADNVEGKLLENSVGLSFLQSYSDEEEIIETATDELLKEAANHQENLIPTEDIPLPGDPIISSERSKVPVEEPESIVGIELITSVQEPKVSEEKTEIYEEPKPFVEESKVVNDPEDPVGESATKTPTIKHLNSIKLPPEKFANLRDDWEVVTPPKSEMKPLSDDELDRSQTPDVRKTKESPSREEKTDNGKQAVKKKKKQDKSEEVEKREKKKDKIKVKRKHGEDKKKKRKHRIKDKFKKDKKKKKTEKKKKGVKGDDFEDANIDRQKIIEDLMEKIDHVEKIKSKKEKQKEHELKDDKDKKKEVENNKPKSDDDLSEMIDKNCTEQQNKNPTPEPVEESRTPERKIIVRKTGTPDTDGYNSHWESDEGATSVAPPVKEASRSWESDEEVFERYYPSEDRPTVPPAPLPYVQSLEIPLNIKPFSRRRTGQKLDQTPPQPVPITLDDELKILEQQNRDLSEERKKLELEKMKVQQLELQYKCLEQQSESDKRKYEEIYRHYKQSRQLKKNNYEVLDVDLSKVKKEKDEDGFDISSSTDFDIETGMADSLENAYEEFMKAVTPADKKSTRKKSSDSDITPSHIPNLMKGEQTTPAQPKIVPNIRIDDLLPKELPSVFDHLDIPLPQPVPVPSPKLDQLPKPLLNIPLPLIVSPRLETINNVIKGVELVKTVPTTIQRPESPEDVEMADAVKKPFNFTIQGKKLLATSGLGLDEDSDEGRRLTPPTVPRRAESPQKEEPDRMEVEEKSENKKKIEKDSHDVKNQEKIEHIKDKPEKPDKHSYDKKIDNKMEKGSLKKKEERIRSRSPRRRDDRRYSRSPAPSRRGRESPRRIALRRSRSPYGRRVSPARRRWTPSPRRRRRTPTPPRRKSSPRRRTPSPRNRPSSPKRRRSSPKPPPKDKHDHVRHKSPIVQSSPMGGLKKSVADSTISDDLLPQPAINHDNDYTESPVSMFFDRNNISRNVDSPQRPPLDIRIHQMVGLSPQKTQPQPQPQSQPPPPPINYHPYNQHPYQQFDYSLPPPVRVAPPVKPRPANKVVQVGNMIQIVPTEDIPMSSVQPSVSNQQILQVGNMLQIVPQTVVPPNAVPPTMDVPVVTEVGADKSSVDEVMKQRRAEREMRRAERDRRRKEKEKRRKEKEKKKQLKLKLRTENLIKKALQQEQEELEEEELVEEPQQWPPPTMVFPQKITTPGKSILLQEGEAGRRTTPRKSVHFADGVRPGEGTSPSAGEELSSPPLAATKLPKEKRFKKVKQTKKSKKKTKIKVKVTKRHDQVDEDLPPPPPPPGSPPPHIFPPRVKTHSINNIHPQYMPKIMPLPQSVYLSYMHASFWATQSPANFLQQGLPIPVQGTPPPPNQFHHHHPLQIPPGMYHRPPAHQQVMALRPMGARSAMHAGSSYQHPAQLPPMYGAATRPPPGGIPWT
ncbi:titin isoform X2 [Aethina tumida]|uniref:titin isoform X2 n=1 Tax=Aethina tumida TaxID=116153 RepID=UPI002148AAB7|nr:titin isoform X2 [Aethina tumida]